MLCIDLKTNDPFFNLAAEECLLKKDSGEYLILYINRSSVVIGKHQIAHREADTEYITKNDIPVIRRISGGGAVYHDPGNLNFSFIIQSSGGKQVDFRKYLLPVMDFLDSLGVKASFEGKNDLKVNGLKVSGNAEHVFHNRVLHHGTLLFDTDLNVLKGALRKDTSHYSTRAIESNPSPVMNLKDTCTRVGDTAEFKLKMLEYFYGQPGNSIFVMPGDLESEIRLLAGSKFRTWEWNYAYGPEYHFNNRLSINGKLHSCILFVKDGIIWECEIGGSDLMADFAKKLIGCRHMIKDMTEVFIKENISIRNDEILKFF